MRENQRIWPITWETLRFRNTLLTILTPLSLLTIWRELPGICKPYIMGTYTVCRPAVWGPGAL